MPTQTRPNRPAVFSRKTNYLCVCVCLCDLLNRVCTSIGLCVCAYPWCCWGVPAIIRRKRLCDCILPTQAGKERWEGTRDCSFHSDFTTTTDCFLGQLMQYVNKSGCLVAKLAICNPVYQQINIYLLVCYLGGSCSRRWCLPSEHRCLRSGMVRGCMACRGSHSVGLCTLEGIDSGMSPPHLHTCHH